MSNWFEKVWKINRQIEILNLEYNPENDCFDEKAWQKQMNKLLKERKKLYKE